MKDQPVVCDERTTAVENASYRLGYLLLSFGILVSVAYRSFVWREASWDLLALVLLGGLVTTNYQVVHRILSRQWALFSAMAALIAAVIAAVIGFSR